MLQQNASVNLYMFYGGTNFGFTAGANNFGPGKYNADLTSYDYDAPMDEAGDPTAKYFALRTAIGEFLPLPDIPLPQPLPKWSMSDPIWLEPIAELLAPRARSLLGTEPKLSHQPNVSFEQLGQYSGYVLYETQLPDRFKADPSVLHVQQLHDRAIVLANGHPLGTLSREQRVKDLPISAGVAGQRLQLLVENQGRINYNVMEDFKGILSQVTLNGKPLVNWTLTGYPLERYDQILALIETKTENTGAGVGSMCSPTVFHGSFAIESNEVLYDTYLDPIGWGKGIAFVNGFNIGRYWPLVGPQRTLYVPRELLRFGQNDVTLVELERSSIGRTLALVDKPILDDF